MKRWLLLLLLALSLLLVITLPVRVVGQWVDLPANIGQLQGTPWVGQARWSQPGQAPMMVEWRWRPGLRWNWQASDGVTQIEGTYRPGAIHRLERVQGQLALERLDLSAWLPGVLPSGRLVLSLDQVEWSEGHGPGLSGEAVWEDAMLSGLLEERLGRVAVVFSQGQDQQRAHIQSLDEAAIMVQGQLVFVDSTYQLDAELRPAPGRDDLARGLSHLAEPQVDGSFRLRLSGQTGW